MADAVTATTIIDGPKSAVIYCTNTSDGTGESAVVKVDVSALSKLQDGTSCSKVRIEKVVFSTVGNGCETVVGCHYRCNCWPRTSCGLFGYPRLFGH